MGLRDQFERIDKALPKMKCQSCGVEANLHWSNAAKKVVCRDCHCDAETETIEEKTMPVPEDMETKDIAPPSNHIKAADMPPGWRADLIISDINVEEFKRDTDQYARNKFVLSFVGKEKTYVCNATNQAFLEAALGNKPAKWVGATITMSVAKVKGPQGPVPGFLIVGARPGTGAPPPAPTPF